MKFAVLGMPLYNSRMIETLETPCTDRFMNLVHSANDRIIICSPFIKSDIVEEVLSTKQSFCDLEVLTASNPSNYTRRSSDVSAIKMLVEKNFVVRNRPNLHAKIYIFDKEKALVTSSNLTNGGLSRNFEYGLLISQDRETINKVYKDYFDIAHSEETGSYDKNNIKDLEKLVPFLEKSHVDYHPDDDNDEIAHIEDTSTIVGAFTGWKAEMFKVLSELKKDTFTLKDVYAFVPRFEKLYPDNHTIQDSMRRNLEDFRDLGLIRFVDNAGAYKKLFN
jgi:phosphatidylserine/phosphatidylglycerophosphate/cardiolipin synthase-like enzyme